MRIGIYDEPPANEARRGAARLARLARAEAQGYDAVWLAQGEAPLTGPARNAYFELGQLATMTSRVELGLHSGVPEGLHPLRVAEDLAVLDIMSSGRLGWAIREPAPGGAGLLREQLTVIRRAWSGDVFAHEGEHLSFPELSCHPRPVREPHPSLWLEGDWPDEAPADLEGRFYEVDRHAWTAAGGTAAIVALFRVAAEADWASLLDAVERLGPSTLLIRIEAETADEAGAEERQGRALEALRAALGR